VIEILRVRSDADIADASALVWAFFAFLDERYPEMRAEIAAYVAGQQVAEKLAAFAEHFNPPAGECLLARRDGAPVGIVMLKPGGAGWCELNRMYVAPEARGHGVGRRLAAEIVETARALGYAEVRLSALHRHDEALPLYRSLGFAPCPPYAGGGPADDPRIRFMRLPLGAQTETA
jgi:GNAT superfamily N-acetyltransferase